MANGAVDKSIQMKFMPGDELLQIDSYKLYAINYLDLLNILKGLTNGVHTLVCARNATPAATAAATLLPKSSANKMKKNKTDSNLLANIASSVTNTTDIVGNDKQESPKKQQTPSLAVVRLLRSRSVEFNNLVMWSKHIHFINLIKGTN